MIDFSSTSDKCYINNELELIIQQIDMLFETTPSDVLGEENYGSKYDKFLHDLRISNEGIRQQVISDLGELNLFGFNYDVNVYILPAIQEDIALINIILKKDSFTYEKSYKIT